MHRDARHGARAYYNYFRDYDSAVGRYVHSDPIGLLGGVDTYGYAWANPIAHSDPTGEFVPAVGLGVVASAVRAVAAAVAAATITGPSAPRPSPSTQDPFGNCPPEDCARLYAAIDAAVKDLKRRYYEYMHDSRGLPEAGPFSRKTHREQMDGRQLHLRRLLDEANIKGCLGYDPQAWTWASRTLYTVGDR
ncbi:MAG: RHS repeat-associated core domain-containing protein [Gammaproteobacteria bacterium]